MESHVIDLRSDTVTRPTLNMRSANLHCSYGDDVYQEDPTVNNLESNIAEFFGKEKALFFPTGTMANLTALLTWCEKRGSEIILGNKSHIFLFEQSGASQIGGIGYSVLQNKHDGTIDIEHIRKAIRDDDIHEPITSLIAIENTHNACGGKILPISYLNDLQILAKEHNLPVHLDGARLWNALEEYMHSASEVASYVDSLSVCLSKGLGAPIGSLLVGNEMFINKARRIRKVLGGGMRQTGFIASAGLIAFDDFKSGILKQDHINAKKIANCIIESSHFSLSSTIQTNIIVLKKNTYSYSDKEVCNFFKKYNIFISLWDENLFRIVIHRDISKIQVDNVIEIFNKLDILMNH